MYVPIRTMARVLKVSDLGLLRAWRSRPASARATADADPDAPYPHDPRWIAWNLWRAACSRRAEGRWPLCWPEADCSADAGRQGSRASAGAEARRSRRGRRQTIIPPAISSAATSVVGGRHHLPADAGRISLPCGRSRRRVAPDRRMGPSSADLKTRVVLDALDMALMARSPTTSSIIRIVRG